MSDNIIECEELVAGYVPGVNILNGCDLVVAAGEFVGIIGPNGAGKSTLMKAVLGLVTVTLGRRAVERRRDHRPASAPASCSAASASSPRPTTCSRH